MRRLIALSFIAVLFISATPLKPPATKRVPVTDTYGSVSVTEDYRWLENANDPAVQKWVEQQNRYSRSILDAIPRRDAIEQRLRELYTDRPASYSALWFQGGRLF